METSQLVFDVIDKLSYPVILLEENEKKEWSQCYSNQAMDNLIERKPHSEEEKEKLSDTDKAQTNWKYETLLQILINDYSEEVRLDSYTLHDIDIFDGIYNVHFNHNKNHLLIIFVQIPIQELFDNITFHDLSVACSSIMIVLDGRGKVIDMNECFLNLVEMNRESALGKSFFETFMPTAVEKIRPYFQDILSQDVYIQHFVTPLIGSNGKNYRINWQVSKIVKGGHTYIIAVGSDITKFVEENLELKQKLKSIRVGFDYFPLAIGYMNVSGKFITTNSRFKKMFNITKLAEKITFDEIRPLAKHTSFNKIKEYLQLIKEMSYNINYSFKGKQLKLKVDIRLLDAKKESSNFYIVVVEKIK